MSYHLFRRAGTAALALAMLAPQAGALYNVSSWAEDSIASAQEAGLTPNAFEACDAKEPITRAEFCTIAVNAYKAVSGKAVFVSGQKPFDDCDNPSVTAAYLLGIVKGTGDGKFNPDKPITRQDLCVMFNNILTAAETNAPALAGEACVEDYMDAAQVSDYAYDPMVTMVDYAIVNGISIGSSPAILAPRSTATREQALIMAKRFCDTFEKKFEATVDPAEDLGIVATPDMVLDISDEEKMNLVYGVTGVKYQTAEEAAAHMIEISVPVWHLESDGSKTASTAYLQVNFALAPIYKAIFQEIFDGDEKFPIYDVGCYSWRTGEHSQGTAVDINPNENMEATINADGSLTPTCGTHWSPDTDPYSIKEGGDVYNAFTRYGFKWGGNAWQSKRDYMHFSFFGR